MELTVRGKALPGYLRNVRASWLREAMRLTL